MTRRLDTATFTVGPGQLATVGIAVRMSASSGIKVGATLRVASGQVSVDGQPIGCRSLAMRWGEQAVAGGGAV
jgi:hypothetical protein